MYLPYERRRRQGRPAKFELRTESIRLYSTALAELPQRAEKAVSIVRRIEGVLDAQLKEFSRLVVTYRRPATRQAITRAVRRCDLFAHRNELKDALREGG